MNRMELALPLAVFALTRPYGYYGNTCACSRGWLAVDQMRRSDVVWLQSSRVLLRQRGVRISVVVEQ